MILKGFLHFRNVYYCSVILLSRGVHQRRKITLFFPLSQINSLNSPLVIALQNYFWLKVAIVRSLII